MQRIKTVFFVLLFVLVGGLLHYVLPQHDIVRITSTEVIRTDFTALNRLLSILTLIVPRAKRSFRPRWLTIIL